jgi:RimJ/RimL family protein N-acetyltransferase
MFQPPYGDRAVVLKDTNAVIGAVGIVPCFDVFEQIPGLRRSTNQAEAAPMPPGSQAPTPPESQVWKRALLSLEPSRAPSAYRVAEMGLFWAIDPDQQRQGYATEAAQALIDFAFRQLRVKRLIATTEHDNAASIGVMRKLGMRVEANPFPDPPWLQVVGVLEHP